MRKRNAEILGLEIALQDFAEFAIVIHYEQVRLGLLRRPTGNVPGVCTSCAFIVHDDSDESLLNHDRPPKQILTTKSLSRPHYDGFLSTMRCYLERTGHQHARAGLDAAEPTTQEGSSGGVSF